MKLVIIYYILIPMQQVPLLPSARIIFRLVLREAVLLLMFRGTSTLLTPISDLLIPCQILNLIKNQRRPFIVMLLLQISINDEAATDQPRSSNWFLRTGIVFSLKVVQMYRNMMHKLI